MNSRFFIRIFAPLLLFAGFALSSCDDGRIYEHTATSASGKVVKLTGTLLGLDQWPAAYRVSIAGFTDDGDEYATIEKSIGADNAGDGRVSIVLSGIKDDVRLVRLCVLDRLRRHIVTFSQTDISSATDTVRMDVGRVNVAMFNAIQQNILNTTCANCHGAANQAAAGLYLTEGRSYEALVGKPSKRVEGKMLVEPGNAAASVLHQVLNTNLSESWHYNHASEVTSADMLQLIDNWINNLKVEN